MKRSLGFAAAIACAALLAPPSLAAAQSTSSDQSATSVPGNKNEHLNQAREEQRREAAKYLDRAESLFRGPSGQSANVSGAHFQQIHNEVQALQRAYETSRPGSPIKDPNVRNWEEQYNLVMKDLSKYSNSVGTSGRTSESGSSQMGSESGSATYSSPEDTLQQVRVDLQRFHDIATNPKWTPPKKK